MPYPEALGPSSIAMSSATAAFIGFMPKFQDIRRADKGDEGMRKDVQLGMVAAFSVSLGIGFIVSNLTGNYYPAGVAVVMCLILFSCYQAALRS